MARVYQSRQMLDPAFIDIMNKRFDQQLDSDKEQSRKVLEAYNKLADNLVTRGGNILQTGAGVVDYYGRKSNVSDMDMDDPYARAAAEKYVRTGDSSSLMEYRKYLAGEEERKRQAAAQEATQKWHEKVRQDEEKKREREAARTMEEKADTYIAMLEDKVSKTGNVNDITGAERTTANNYIKSLREKGIDTTLLEARMAKLQVSTVPVPPGGQIPDGNDGKSTEQLENEKKNRAEKIKNDAAALTEQAKTVNPRDKEAVDVFNASLEEVKSRRDAEGLTAEIKLPDPIKFVAKPTLDKAREGYKKGIYTAKQMKTWGYKWNDDIGDWE